MIDAPVTGGVMGARVGKLNFLVGGSNDAVKLASPLLEIMGQKILHAGDQGSGVGVKICNNMSLGISMIAASEALMLAKRLKMSGLGKEYAFDSMINHFTQSKTVLINRGSSNIDE